MSAETMKTGGVASIVGNHTGPMRAVPADGRVVGPVGFMAAFANAAAVELCVLLGAPVWVVPLLLVPLALILLPGLSRRIGIGMLIGWATVPLGVLMSVCVAVAGVIAGLSALRRWARVRRGEHESVVRDPVDPWLIGALGMSVVSTLCLLLTWVVARPAMVSVTGRVYPTLEEESLPLAATVIAIAVVLALLGSRRPQFRAARTRGVALALAAGALLTPIAWNVADDVFSDTVRHDPRTRLATDFGIVLPSDYRYVWGESGCHGFQDITCFDEYRFTAPRDRFDTYEQIFQPVPNLFPRNPLLPLRAGDCVLEQGLATECAGSVAELTGFDDGIGVEVVRTDTRTMLRIQITEQRLAR